MAKKILMIVFAVLDGILLVVIAVSAIVSALFREPAVNPVSPTVAQTETVAESTAEAAATEAPKPTQAPTAAPKPTEAPTAAPTQKPAAPKSNIPDSGAVSTSADAGVRDAEGFSWSDGWVVMSSGAERITDANAVKGGWKAVMISDPNNRRNGMFTDYMNVNISGSASEMTVTLGWSTRYFNNEGMSVDAGGYDSTVKGSFSDGSLYATGSGSLMLTGFWYDNGKEYAVGTYTWQDGVDGYIGLIRP